MQMEQTDTRRTGPPYTMPLRMIDVGESCFWPGKTADEVSRRYWKLRPLKFRARTVIRNGVLGARVWRIA